MSRLGTLLTLGYRRRRTDDDYRALQRYLAEESVNELAERGVDLAASRVLEVGAGRGGFSEVLAGACGEFIASDMTEHESFVRLGIPFQALDVNGAFPFADDTFDVIISTSLIEHLNDPDNFLAESSRVLVPDGRLYLSFPPFYSLLLVGGHQFKPFHLLGERVAVTLTNRFRGTHFPNYANAYGDFGLRPLRIADVQDLLSSYFTIEDTYTRFSPVNTARWPGWLADLTTWHACFLASKPSREHQPDAAG